MIDSAFYRKMIHSVSDGVYFVDAEKKISFWNKTAEQITGYTAEEVMGRVCSDHIMMHVDLKGKSICSKGCPLGTAMLRNETVQTDLYLLHKKGYRVPVNVRVHPVLSDGRVIGAVELFSDRSRTMAMQQRMKDLTKMALWDPAAQIANTRYMRRMLNSRLEEVRRYGSNVGVLFADVDNFKQINDRYGHQSGDAVLQMVARTFKFNMRPFDVAGRWGGDEFLAVIYNTDNRHLQSISERLRILVQESRVTVKDSTLKVTISIGGSLARGDDTPASLLKRIDALMYESKEHGRDRATIG